MKRSKVDKQLESILWVVVALFGAIILTLLVGLAWVMASFLTYHVYLMTIS